ncbi:MAG: pilus assembly protein CpaB [Actinomycetota bacterium]|nr:pilus assembly protein CpaB [Actinomycetota bacterium]
MPLPSIPRPAARRRRRFPLRRSLRRPIPFWIVACVLTALTVMTVMHVTGAAAAERDRWGARRAAVVARRDLAPGVALRPGDVVVRMLPAALVPAGALTDAPAGQVVAAWIGRGEVVLNRRLAPAGLSATAALLPRGTRGVAVPTGTAPLPVVVGDRVDLLATVDGAQRPTFAVATDAVVVAVSADAVTVAVDEAQAPQVVDAVTTASVTLVLSARSSPRSG